METKESSPNESEQEQSGKTQMIHWADEEW